MLYLREWRLAKGLTLKSLETRTGIGFRVLSKYELEHIDTPRSKLKLIADALGIDEGYLFRKPEDVRATEELSHV